MSKDSIMALFGPMSAPQPPVSVSGFPGSGLGQMSQAMFGQFQQFPGAQPAQPAAPLGGLQTGAFNNIANISPAAPEQNSKNHTIDSLQPTPSSFQIFSLTSTNPNKQITTRRWQTTLFLTQTRLDQDNYSLSSL